MALATLAVDGVGRGHFTRAEVYTAPGILVVAGVGPLPTESVTAASYHIVYLPEGASRDDSREDSGLRDWPEGPRRPLVIVGSLDQLRHNADFIVDGLLAPMRTAWGAAPTATDATDDGALNPTGALDKPMRTATR